MAINLDYVFAKQALDNIESILIEAEGDDKILEFSKSLDEKFRVNSSAGRASD